jgi:hypothetical protein
MTRPLAPTPDRTFRFPRRNDEYAMVDTLDLEKNHI